MDGNENEAGAKVFIEMPSRKSPPKLMIKTGINFIIEFFVRR